VASGLGTVVGIGVDAVDLHRFRDALVRRPRMSTRLFTEGEQAYASRAVDPTARLATRFAAKEATMKALGVGLGAFAFVDVEVVRSGLDAPYLVLSGEAAKLAARAGVARWHLSLTHTHLVAMASVLAERDPLGDDLVRAWEPGVGAAAWEPGVGAAAGEPGDGAVAGNGA
jgi:holo-[acyl-carrier protein] synthase